MATTRSGCLGVRDSPWGSGVHHHLGLAGRAPRLGPVGIGPGRLKSPCSTRRSGQRAPRPGSPPGHPGRPRVISLRSDSVMHPLSQGHRICRGPRPGPPVSTRNGGIGVARVLHHHRRGVQAVCRRPYWVGQGLTASTKEKPRGGSSARPTESRSGRRGWVTEPRAV